MEIRLAQIRDQPFRWQETVEIPAGILDRPELVGLGPVSWQGEVSRGESGFVLTARYAYRQALTCFRCLETVEEPVEGDLQLLVVVDPDRPVTAETALEEEELGLVYLDREVLDGRALLLEQLQLNIPMKPLCRPDCAGLCPSCGANRNLGPCSCRQESHDPRWSKLAAFGRRLAGED